MHIVECTEVDVPCEMCMQMMARSSIKKHISNSCPKAVVPCPFVEHGCSVKCKREILQEHMMEATNSHLLVS